MALARGRQWILAGGPQGNEHGAARFLHQNCNVPARLEDGNQAPVVLLPLDRMAIDPEDGVTRLDAGSCRGPLPSLPAMESEAKAGSPR